MNAGGQMADEIHIHYIEIIEPKWTPLEVDMFLAGLCPVKSISLDEAREMFPRRDE